MVLKELARWLKLEQRENVDHPTAAPLPPVLYSAGPKTDVLLMLMQRNKKIGFVSMCSVSVFISNLDNHHHHYYYHHHHPTKQKRRRKKKREKKEGKIK